MKNIALFIILFSFTASADISGTWVGGGQNYYKNAHKRCPLIQMKLRRTAEKFYIVSGGYQCGAINAEYPFADFKIQGSNLVYADEIVGQIFDHGVKLVRPEEGFTLRLTFNQELLSFEEVWETADGPFIVRGQLVKSTR